jgi:SAM-dependent methyltransferase
MSVLQDLTCRTCAEPFEAVPFAAREMLLETHESFDYVECTVCGSIQIVHVPTDLERFYPSTYRHALPPPGWLGRTLRRQRGAYVRGAKWNLLGGLLLRLSRPEWVDWMVHTHARARSRILDVGSGEGTLLAALSAAGYADLTGIDPFMDPEGFREAGFRFHRRTIDQEPGTYDIVMLHHSLEHMADPAAALEHVGRVLDPHGWAIVRMPVAGSYGWRTYRQHWLGLEPPRHLTIPSVVGMRRLAERAGFSVEALSFDSSGCCYAVSELWAAGRSLPYPRRPWQKKATEMLGEERVAQLQRLSRERNAANDGDHAVYYLRVQN